MHLQGTQRAISLFSSSPSIFIFLHLSPFLYAWTLPKTRTFLYAAYPLTELRSSPSNLYISFIPEFLLMRGLSLDVRCTHTHTRTHKGGLQYDVQFCTFCVRHSQREPPRYNWADQACLTIGISSSSPAAATSASTSASLSQYHCHIINDSINSRHRHHQNPRRHHSHHYDNDHRLPLSYHEIVFIAHRLSHIVL